jgi:transposase
MSNTFMEGKISEVLDIGNPFWTVHVNESRETVRLGQWFKNVRDSGIKEFLPVVSMIQSYLSGVLNYFKHRLTNAESEAFNNKINVIKRAAFGFRDIEYFKLKKSQRCSSI